MNVVINNQNYQRDIADFYLWALFLVSVELEAAYQSDTQTWMEIHIAKPQVEFEGQCVLDSTRVSSLLPCLSCEIASLFDGHPDNTFVSTSRRFASWPKISIKLCDPLIQSSSRRCKLDTTENTTTEPISLGTGRCENWTSPNFFSRHARACALRLRWFLEQLCHQPASECSLSWSAYRFIVTNALRTTGFSVSALTQYGRREDLMCMRPRRQYGRLDISGGSSWVPHTKISKVSGGNMHAKEILATSVVVVS